MTYRQADISVINKWVDVCKGKEEDKRDCVWCSLYVGNGKCSDKCPLMQIDDSCDDSIGDFVSTWKKWQVDKTSKNAKAMLLKCIEAIRKIRRYKDKRFCDEALKRVK